MQKSKKIVRSHEVIPVRFVSMQRVLKKNSHFYCVKTRQSVVSSLPFCYSSAIFRDCLNPNALLLRSLQKDLEKPFEQQEVSPDFKKKVEEITSSINKSLQYGKALHIRKIKLDPELSYTKKMIKNILTSHRLQKLKIN